MRKIVKKSKRNLTSRRLSVDWCGYGTLFFYMSKEQMRHALVNGEAKAKKVFHGRAPITSSFPVRRFPSGSIAIGCEHFNKQEVAELKKWSRK